MTLPNINSKWIGLLLLAIFGITLFALFCHPLGDPDLYIHLRDGRHWINTDFNVNLDPFSYMTSERPFDKIEPLFKISVYQL